MNESRQCETCGKNFQWQNSRVDGFTFIFRPTECPGCEAKTLKKIRDDDHESQVGEIRRETKSNIRTATPPLFQETRIDHPAFHRKAWEKLKSFKPTKEQPWLGLIGEPGTCKSRIAYMIAKKLILDAISEKKTAVDFRFTTAHGIADLCDVKTTAPFEEKEKARESLIKLRKCHVLLIDDLGKERKSPAIAAEMYAIIDHRYSHSLPTIWTANTKPEILAKDYPPDMAGPFAGRLNDRSRLINFTPARHAEA